MLHLGFAGLGWWGTELADAASRLLDLVAIRGGYAPDRGHMQAFQERFGGVAYASFQALLADDKVDAVVLSTPHSLHCNQIIAATGLNKHVFVEKPLALTQADADRAIEAARQVGLVLAVGHNRRFAAAAKELKSWIEAGKLGTILHVEAHFSGNSAMRFAPQNWRADRIESPAGALVSIGLHMIDIVQWLLGPMARVSCVAKRQVLSVDIDDTTAALFELESGVTGSLATLFATPITSSLKLYGTNGHAEARGDFTDLTWHPQNGSPQKATLDPVDTLEAEITAFAAAITQGKPFPVTPEQARANVSVIEAMVSSAEANAAWRKIAC